MHMDEVSICDTIDAHLHDRFVTHAHLHAAIAAATVAVLATTWELALASVSCLSHAILIIVFVRLTTGTLRNQVLIQTDEAFFRALELCLLIWLHGLLLGVDIVSGCVTYVDFCGSQADHCDLLLHFRVGLLALATLELRVLRLLLFFRLLLSGALYLNGRRNLGLVSSVTFVGTPSLLLVNFYDCQVSLGLARRIRFSLKSI